MNDTHDERGGDERGPFRNDLRTQLVTAGTEAAEQWLTVRANRKMSDVNRKRLAGHVVNVLWDEIEHAAVEMAQYVGDEQLAAATARAEKAERQRDVVIALGNRSKWQRDEARAQMYLIIGAVEHAYALNAYVELEPGEEAPTIEALWAEVREIRGVAPDAAPEALSEPVERSETSGGHGEGSDSSTTAAGLSELHAFVVCATCNGSGGYCQRCREGQAGLPHSAHIVTCPDCLGGGTYPPATEDGQHG